MFTKHSFISYIFFLMLPNTENYLYTRFFIKINRTLENLLEQRINRLIRENWKDTKIVKWPHHYQIKLVCCNKPIGEYIYIYIYVCVCGVNPRLTLGLLVQHIMFTTSNISISQLNKYIIKYIVRLYILSIPVI